MDNQIKMNLRTHRQRDYTATESQHPEDFRYSRANYSKEYVSPALELNSAAKLLAKFLNSINKRSIYKDLELREKIRNDEQEQKAATQLDPLSHQKYNDKDSMINNTARKNLLNKKEQKQDTTKKQKEKRQISSQNNHKEQRILNSTENSKFSKSSNQPPSMALNPADHDLYKMLAQYNQGKIGSGLKIGSSLNMDAVNKAIIQQQSYVNNTQFFKEKQKGNTSQASNRMNQSKGKLFGRSSYHVAIAYHIHLKRIYEAGTQMNQMMLDPTYPAKKLKTQQQKPLKE